MAKFRSPSRRQGDVGPPEKTITLYEWAQANGYDPETRTYRETESRPGAVPGVHCNIHRPGSRRKVA